MIKCNCIADHKKALKKTFGPDTALTNIRTMMNFTTGQVWLALEPLRFRYHKKKPDGTYEKKWSTSWVESKFCSFCGKGHEKESPKSTNKKKK